MARRFLHLRAAPLLILLAAGGPSPAWGQSGNLAFVRGDANLDGRTDIIFKALVEASTDAIEVRLREWYP
jgi:hypothetical protein